MYLISMVLGASGALLLWKFGSKWGFVDYPCGRSSHSSDTPKAGGIGIVATFLLLTLVLGFSPQRWIFPLFIAFIGLIADKWNISVVYRLITQFIIVLFAVWNIFGYAPIVRENFYLISFFVIFILATTNWYNFMDGINGIAGITGVVGFSLAAYLINTIHPGDIGVKLSLGVAIACIGFLPFNFPKARVFLGDVGSVFLGFVFAYTVVLVSKNMLDFICFASFLFCFYIDELTTMCVRLGNRENIFKPHRRHLYQILANELNIPHWVVSLGYGVVQAFVGVSIIKLRPLGITSVLLALIFYSIAFILFSVYVRIKANYLGGMHGAG